VGLFFTLLVLLFAGFGLTLTPESEPPRRSHTYTVPPSDFSAPPELWPKRSTHNAPDG
jgi:hypothetical protein